MKVFPGHRSIADKASAGVGWLMNFQPSTTLQRDVLHAPVSCWWGTYHSRMSARVALHLGINFRNNLKTHKTMHNKWRIAIDFKWIVDFIWRVVLTLVLECCECMTFMLFVIWYHYSWCMYSNFIEITFCTHYCAYPVVTSSAA